MLFAIKHIYYESYDMIARIVRPKDYLNYVKVKYERN